MAVELFKNATTRPDAIFCDSCFLLDLLIHEVSTVVPLLRPTPGQINRAAEVAAFFHRYLANGTKFVSSPYTFSEVTHAIGRGLLPKDKHTWKLLKRKDPQNFPTLHSAAMVIIEDAWKRVEQYGITFNVPEMGQPTPYGVNVNTPVVEAAIELKNHYGTLDAADAFHIASGVACNVTWFATTDLDWKDVIEINVFCDK